MQKGCACRFLYGPGTDQDKIVEIEKALEARNELQVEVQFYRKNGKKTFESKLMIHGDRQIKKMFLPSSSSIVDCGDLY